MILLHANTWHQVANMTTNNHELGWKVLLHILQTCYFQTIVYFISFNIPCLVSNPNKFKITKKLFDELKAESFVKEYTIYLKDTRNKTKTPKYKS